MEYALIAIVSAIIGYVVQQGMARTQQDYNEENMQTQFYYDQQLMEKQSELNSISSQKEQWSEAGFHPSVMLNDHFQPASLASTPSGGMPSMGNIPTIMESLLQGGQLSNLESDTRGKNIENEYAPLFKHSELQKLHATIDKIGTEKKYTDEQWQILHATSEFVVARSAADLDKTMKEIDYLQKLAGKIGAETTNVNYQNDLLEWKKQFRAATNVELNDSNLAMAFELARGGQLTTVFQDLINSAKELISSAGNNAIDLLVDGVNVDNFTFDNFLKMVRKLNPAISASDELVKLYHSLRNQLFNN